MVSRENLGQQVFRSSTGFDGRHQGGSICSLGASHETISFGCGLAALVLPIMKHLGGRLLFLV